MANRSTQRTKRRPDPPVAPRPMRQSLAENHSGQMMFDNEFMGGQSSKRMRSSQLNEERKKPLALRQLTYPLFATSAQADIASADGSVFSVATDKIPMHIPQSATNVYASLLKASVPYKWPNYTASESIVVKAEVPRTTVVGSEPVSNPVTVSTTTPIVFEISNYYATGSAGAINLSDSLGTTTLTRTVGNLFYDHRGAIQDQTFARLGNTNSGGIFTLAAADYLGTSTTSAYKFTTTIVFALPEDQANATATLFELADASVNAQIALKLSGQTLTLDQAGDGSQSLSGSSPKTLMSNILGYSGGLIVLTLAFDKAGDNLELWINGVRTRVGTYDSNVTTAGVFRLGNTTAANVLLKEFRVFPGALLNYANLRSEHDALMRKYDIRRHAKSHLVYAISVGDVGVAQSFRTDLATSIGAPATSKEFAKNVAVRNHFTVQDGDDINFFSVSYDHAASIVEHSDTASSGMGVSGFTFGNADQNDQNTFVHHLLGTAAEAEPNTLFYGYARVATKAKHLEDIANRLKNDVLDTATLTTVSDVSVVLLLDRHLADDESAFELGYRAQQDILAVFDDIRSALPNARSRLYASKCSTDALNSAVETMARERTDVVVVGSAPAAADFTSAELQALAQDMYDAISESRDGIKIPIEVVKPTLTFSSTTTSASDAYATRLSGGSFTLQASLLDSFLFSTGDPGFEGALQTQSITDWRDLTSGNEHQMSQTGGIRAVRNGGNTYGVLLEGSQILVSDGNSALNSINSALGASPYVDGEDGWSVYAYIDLSQTTLDTSEEYVLFQMFDDDGGSADGHEVVLAYHSSHWRMSIRLKNNSILGSRGSPNRLSATDADDRVCLDQPFLIHWTYHFQESSKMIYRIYGHQLESNITTGGVHNLYQNFNGPFNTVNPAEGFDKFQFGDASNPSSFKMIVHELFVEAGPANFMRFATDSDTYSSIRGKYASAYANPVYDLHSLDTTNYLTTVASNRSTYNVFVPPGTYSTVAEYVAKAQEVVNELLLEESGVEDVVALDIDPTYSSGSMVTYDLQAHFNQVMDGNDFFDTDKESVSYALVNERINQAVDIFVRDQFANRATLVEEAGDFVIIGDQSTTGHTWESVLIVDKRSLTVYHPTRLGDFAHAGIDTENMTLQSISAGLDTTGDAICAFAYKDVDARWGSILYNLTDDVKIHKQERTDNAKDSVFVAWDKVGKDGYYLTYRDDASGAEVGKVFRIDQSASDNASLTAVDLSMASPAANEIVSLAVGNQKNSAAGKNSLFFIQKHLSSSNTYTFEWRAYDKSTNTLSSNDGAIPAIVNTSIASTQDASSSYHLPSVVTDSFGNHVAVTFPGNHSDPALVVFDLRAANSYKVHIQANSPGHSTYGEPVRAQFNKNSSEVLVAYSEGQVEAWEKASGNRLRTFKVIPDTGANIGLASFVISQVTNSATTSSSDHMFFVGDFSQYDDGGVAVDLATPDILHRTSIELISDPIQSFFENRELPTEISVDFTNVLRHLDASSPLGAKVTVDLLTDPRVSATFDLFPGDIRPTDQLSEQKSFTVAFPQGSYSPQTLVDTINLEVQKQDPALRFPLLGVVNYSALDKVAFTSDLSTSFLDNAPRKVTLTWDKTSVSDTATIANFAELVGWDLSTGDIELEATTASLQTVYSGILSNKYTFDKIKNLFLVTNFTRAGMNPLRDPSQILAKIPVDVPQGQLIVSEPSVPLRVDSYSALQGESGASLLEFRLVDETGTAVPIGADNTWSVNVLIEWEQDIDPLRLAQSQTESKFA